MLALMDTLIHFVGFLSALAVGVAAGIICVIQPLIIILFGIPLTLSLNRQGAMKTYAPIARYCVSLVLLLGTFSLVTWIMWSFFSKMFFVYIAGVAMVVVVGARKCGANPNNLADYMQSHAKLLDPNWVRRAAEASGPQPRSSAPNSSNVVVAAFGEVLERSDPGPSAVADVKSLPYPKEEIKRAILAMLMVAADHQTREHLKVAYLSLAHWQNGVGPTVQGITLQTLTTQMSFDDLIHELGPRGEEFKRWKPILKAETDALIDDLRQLGYWDNNDVQPGAPGDGPRPAGSARA